MICPACESGLKPHKYRGLLIDVCRQCGGIWFDPGEMKEYIEFMIEDHDDIPNAKIEIGKEIEATGDETGLAKGCPRCDVAMTEFNYAYDSNIMLDRCPSCGGVWTDGEEAHKLAIHRKGNPRLDKLGASVMDHYQKGDVLHEMGKLGKDLSDDVTRSWYFFPRIILPLGDDVYRSTFPFFVICIILINTAIHFYQVFGVEDIEAFIMQYARIPSRILEGEGYFTFISAMFIHGDWLHLIGNMYFFWIFADNMEDALGHFRFVIFYFLCGFCGGLLHIAFYSSSGIPSIGASGAISGIMGGYFVLYPHAKIGTLLISTVIGIPAYIYLGVWIAFQILYGSIYLSMGVTGGVGWLAHIGGFVSGALMAWFYKKRKTG